MDPPFTVDSGSGVVRIRNVLDFDVQQSYTLTIRATVCALHSDYNNTVSHTHQNVVHDSSGRATGLVGPILTRPLFEDPEFKIK